MENSQRRLLFGTFVRRERWTLSLRGRLLLCLVILSLAWGLRNGLYSFLAVNGHPAGEILVVEGWIHSYSIGQVATNYHTAHYSSVLIVNDIYNVSNKWESGRYKYQYIAEELVALGVPKERLHQVEYEVQKRDRTYHAALAVKQWIQAQGKPVSAVNVATIGPHARRSRLLFQKALGSEMRVGVIALEERAYDPDHWWRSSEGVREVLFEAFAYLYARFLFSPPQE